MAASNVFAPLAEKSMGLKANSVPIWSAGAVPPSYGPGWSAGAPVVASVLVASTRLLLSTQTVPAASTTRAPMLPAGKAGGAPGEAGGARPAPGLGGRRPTHRPRAPA